MIPNFDKPFVAFQPKGKSIDVMWGAITYIKPDEGKFSCYVSGFDIYFSASTMDEINKKTLALTHMYMDHFALHSKDKIKSLVMQLHKSGFKATYNDAMTLKKFCKNEIVKSKFNSDNLNLPQDFTNANRVINNGELAMAI